MDEDPQARELCQARRKTRFGSLFIRGVHRATGELAGAYLYFGRRRAEAMTLQIVARPEAAELVLGSLFAACGGARLHGGARRSLS